MATAILKRLKTKFYNRCHYCDRTCNNTVNSPRQGTKDHVVPRFFGGQNVFENYVLACQECNSKRGNQLHFCACAICKTLISEALNSQTHLDFVFDGLVKFNKPQVEKNSKGKWIVRVGTGAKGYNTFEEAIAAALHGPMIRSKINGF